MISRRLCYDPCGLIRQKKQTVRQQELSFDVSAIMGERCREMEVWFFVSIPGCMSVCSSPITGQLIHPLVFLLSNFLVKIKAVEYYAVRLM